MLLKDMVGGCWCEKNGERPRWSGGGMECMDDWDYISKHLSDTMNLYFEEGVFESMDISIRLDYGHKGLYDGTVPW